MIPGSPALISSPQPIKTAIDILVVIGTGLRAFFTYLAARATRDSATQAKISAEAAQKTLETATLISWQFATISPRSRSVSDCGSEIHRVHYNNV
jgi:hypothetical protein